MHHTMQKRAQQGGGASLIRLPVGRPPARVGVCGWQHLRMARPGRAALVGCLTVCLLGGFSASVVLLLVVAPGWASLWPVVLAGSGSYLVAELMHRHPPP